MDTLPGLILFIGMGLAVASCVLLMEKAMEFMALDFVDCMKDCIEDIKMLFPKYKGQKKLEAAYNLLQENYVSIREKTQKTPKDEENLKNIEESMALIKPHIPER